jgi:8-oxo-dGTP diphosphatase
MNKRHLLVVAAVIERGDEILVSLRHPKGTRPSQWEFPGGKIEPGETEQLALVREIREELGVECEVGELIRRVTHEYSDTVVELAFYRTVITQGDPKPLSMEEIRWVPRSQLAKLDFLAADKPFVEELVRGAA